LFFATLLIFIPIYLSKFSNRQSIYRRCSYRYKCRVLRFAYRSGQYILSVK
jgi:hypothetical protein